MSSLETSFAGAKRRICLDFGTAFSKASAFVEIEGPAREAVHALAIGAAAGADHPLLTPSVMFVDQGRILFGPRALERARACVAVERDPILSFKLILAARDIEQALNLKVRPSVDPTGTLRYRDALVLYLAYLDQLILAAIHRDETLPQDLLGAPRRYTSPIWRTRAEGDRAMARLFDEAAIVSARLGSMLLASDGASIAQCKDALDKAQQALGIGQLEAGVFEAHAAAAAYGAFSRNARDFMLVIDMGAGTTDIAGFALKPGAQGPVLAEVAGARQSCGLAGDEIDQIISSLLIEKFKLKHREDQAVLWRSLGLSARGLKRDLFLNGKCSFLHAGASRSLQLKELLRSRRFKEFCAALTAACAISMRALHTNAFGQGNERLSILLAGGGANLSFLRDVAADAAGQAGVRAQADIEIFGENWYLPNGFDPNLANAFPQVAIALGGALATLTDEPMAAEPATS
ncbi:MAG: Hsp70 family protein [Hyphomonadaceae bacterium]|nr:Hsp70 family protein [Hyphomonadaceae bacterium]